MHHNLKSLSRSLESDKLITMIKESSGIREKNLEVMVKSGEEKSEIYLERHIRDLMKERHKDIRAKLSEDDIMEYVIIAAMILVAIVGLAMWRKLKE